VVYALEDSVDSGNPDATAHKLEQLYASQKDSDSWKSAGGTADIAWESNQVARTQIYQALRIPVEPCMPEDNSCMNAPGGPLDLDGNYMNKAATIAGEQLAKAGFRLASLLNGIWVSSVPSQTMR
jgi:S1/P1 Nuclease